MARFGVIIAAAGSSKRFGGEEKKQFEELVGRAVFVRALEPFLARDDVGGVVVAVASEDMERIKLRWGSHLGFHGVKLVAGGPERVDSVAAAFEHLPADCDHVAIHDGARPLVDPELIEKVFAEAVATGAAIAAVPLTATLKQVDSSKRIVATCPRDHLWLAQTPQAFRRDLYAQALNNRAQLASPVTDDAQLVEAVGGNVAVVVGKPDNFKITTSADLAMARQLCKARGITGPAEPPRHHRF